MESPQRAPEPARKRPRTSSPPPSAPAAVREGNQCPYMDTITRTALDFDLPPICSISLQSHNVYICLVCGKYVQGRSPSTPAYAHSLQAHHHLFLNVSTQAVHCLPDGYRVDDPGIQDLKAALRPTFSQRQIADLDSVPFRFRVLDRSFRLRGAVPLDNLQHTDYANAVFHVLLRPFPVRNFLLSHYASSAAVENGIQKQSEKPLQDPPAQITKLLAALCAKIWASQAFRSHIAPHELMHLVARLSKGRFGQLKQANPVDFTAWLLNTLVQGTQNSSTQSSTAFSQLVEQTFRGEMQVETIPDAGEAKKSITPFWFLPLDLPPKPLFKDTSERTLVAQIPLRKLLKKFDGVTRQHIVKKNSHRTYKVTKLPPYLMLVIRRFSKSNFGVQKNPCVVHLPPEGLQASDLVPTAAHSKYTLIAAVLHEGSTENGKYRIALRHDATNSWHDLTDLTVKPTPEQLIALSDTYMLLYAKS